MKKWNGKDSSGKYQYPEDQIDSWNMTIDENGTVYYMTKEEKPNKMIWCPAIQLTSHLHHILIQIPAR